MSTSSFTHEIIQPNNNLDVYIELFDDSGSYVSSHWHNSIEIIYLTSGTLQLDIGGKAYKMKEGDCILINSGIVHSSRCIGHNTSILVQIPTGLLNKYMPDYKNSLFDFNLNSNTNKYNENIDEIRNILKEMEYLDLNPSIAGRLKFSSLVFELLYKLYTNFRIPISSKHNQKSSFSLTRFEPILEYTKKNYINQISIQEIADVAHLQPEYFCRKFKQLMGQTYLEYLNDLRIAHIYKDLLNTDDHINQILERHGFTNTKLFYKTFKDKFGCTPKKVRK